MVNEAKNDYKRRVRAELKLLVFEYLLTHPCIDCKYSNVLALEFDHVKGKKKESIARMINNCCPWEEIKQEIEKCVVRCANCHRLKTVAQLGYWKQI